MSGPRLRHERERRGLTLDEVAEGARIPRRYLVALEEDDTATLPPGPFLRSYRRQYLTWMGIDPDAWTEAHAPAASPGELSPIDHDPGSADEPTATATIPRVDELPVARLVVLGFLLTLAIVLGLRVSSRLVDREAAAPEPEPVAVDAATSQTVRVRAVEDTKVVVETDDSFHHNGTLRAGTSVEVESKVAVSVEVADLTRVVIHHNGDRIEPLHNLSASRRLVFLPE